MAVNDNDRITIDKSQLLPMTTQCFIDMPLSGAIEFDKVIEIAKHQLATELAYALLELLPMEVAKIDLGTRIRAKLTLIKPVD